MKAIEFFGVMCAIIGSFLVSNGFAAIGFPVFLLSSLALLSSAAYQRNFNLLFMQSVFCISNIMGVFHYVR